MAMDTQEWLDLLNAAGIAASEEEILWVLSNTPAHELQDRFKILLSGGQGTGEKPTYQRNQIHASLIWDQLMQRMEEDQPEPEWVPSLPEFAGELITAGEALEMAAWDFGKVRRRKPAAVLRPAHTGDVASAIQFCREWGVGLSPRGFAHSAGAQMQSRRGLVLDMKSMSKICSLESDYGESSFCEVEAGAGWDVVLKAAMEKGLTPPIVTDWLKVSVGGTISMGGFGFMSFWRGTQMDHLLELEVVTGTGEVVRCSSEQNSELFDAVRGTHGKFGIITRAKIPLEPAPEKVRLVQACYGSLSKMLDDFEVYAQERKTDLIHAFAAEKNRESIVTKMNSTETLPFEDASIDAALSNIKGEWVYNLELVDFIGGPHDGQHPRVDESALKCEPGLAASWELGWEEFCFRIPPLVLEEQYRGAAPHPELCSWVPMDSDGRKLLTDEFERLHPEGDTGNGPVLFFPLKTDQVTPPWFRLPTSEYCLFWGLLRRADPGTPERIAELMVDNEEIFERILEIGGQRYLPDTPPETASFWKCHFGPLWQKIVRSRMRWDPDGVLGSSFGWHSHSRERKPDDDSTPPSSGTP